MHQPTTSVINHVEANMKYQLQALSTSNLASGPSRTLIDVLVMPASSEAVPAMKRLAEKPRLALSQPQNMPTIGLRPAPMNASAPRGGTSTEHVSDARFPQVPISAIT